MLLKKMFWKLLIIFFIPTVFKLMSYNQVHCFWKGSQEMKALFLFVDALTKILQAIKRSAHSIFYEESVSHGT